jgi:hypothetical protein
VTTQIDKQHILAEIRRIADANGGKPPGVDRFERETAIRKQDWYPHYWLRWGDAVVEAGFSANKFIGRIADELVIQAYINLARELGRIPIHGEIRRKASSDKAFPCEQVFRRFGGKRQLIEVVRQYCQDRSDYGDIIALCGENKPTTTDGNGIPHVGQSKPQIGFVYLMKSGRHCKIGHTVSVGSRERQLAIKIPVPPKTIHAIKTDDPVGVEAYWHRRFSSKRGEGEWFDLSHEDVEAFKCWKRIV